MQNLEKYIKKALQPNLLSFNQLMLLNYWVQEILQKEWNLLRLNG